jgi:DNA repair protein RadC
MSEEPPSFVREMEVRYKGPRIGFAKGGRVVSSRMVDKFAREKLKLTLSPVEYFYLLPLDAKHNPLGFYMVAKGGMSFCAIAMADVIRPVIASGAYGFICVHNHPSGEPSPSPDDISLTERIAIAAKTVGLELVDHVIIGDPEYFSFLDAGLIARDK